MISIEVFYSHLEPKTNEVMVGFTADDGCILERIIRVEHPSIITTRFRLFIALINSVLFCLLLALPYFRVPTDHCCYLKLH